MSDTLVQINKVFRSKQEENPLRTNQAIQLCRGLINSFIRSKEMKIIEYEILRRRYGHEEIAALYCLTVGWEKLLKLQKKKKHSVKDQEYINWWRSRNGLCKVITEVNTSHKVSHGVALINTSRTTLYPIVHRLSLVRKRKTSWGLGSLLEPYFFPEPLLKRVDIPEEKDRATWKRRYEMVDGHTFGAINSEVPNVVVTPKEYGPLLGRLIGARMYTFTPKMGVTCHPNLLWQPAHDWEEEIKRALDQGKPIAEVERLALSKAIDICGLVRDTSMVSVTEELK